MSHPSNIARALLHGERDDEIAQLRAVLDAARDLIMAHRRGYFGQALKVDGKDSAFIAALIDAVESVRS